MLQPRTQESPTGMIVSLLMMANCVTVAAFGSVRSCHVGVPSVFIWITPLFRRNPNCSLLSAVLFVSRANRYSICDPVTLTGL